MLRSPKGQKNQTEQDRCATFHTLGYSRSIERELAGDHFVFGELRNNVHYVVNILPIK